MSPDDALTHIDWHELPQTLFDDIREKLWTYTVSVFDVGKEGPTYGGTATCIGVGGAGYLLTAGHVWQALRGDRFALSQDTDLLLTPIPKKVVEPWLASKHTGSEWGPDLALVKLPDACVRDLKTRKAFYDLEKRRAESVDHDVLHDRGLWAVIGAPSVQSTIGKTEAVLRTSVFASGIVTAVTRDGWDYLDLAFDHRGHPDLPTSYGGISGSGLWQLPVNKSASTGQVVWDGTARLEGLAFYEKFVSPHAGVIRCHGRKSLYVRALT